MSDTSMQGSPEPRPARDRSPSARGHETSDASGFYVSMFALALAATVGLVLLLLVWLFGRFEASAERRDPVQSPLADDQVPPKPHLETRAGDALSESRTREDEELIDRAIEVLAERGLPEPEGPREKPGSAEERAGAAREEMP